MQIVQLARHIGPGGGVSGVAFAVERELEARGHRVESITLESLGWKFGRGARGLLTDKLRLLVEVVYYSVVAPLALRAKYSKDDWISITHNDSILGDVYVNHGLHKALIAPIGGRRDWKRILRNPVHIFVLMREGVRFSLRLNLVIVNFGLSGELELRRYYPLRDHRFAIIPNGADPERFFPSPELRHAGRKELACKDELVLLFVGHEFDRKGLYYVLAALPQLPPAVHLLVAGGDLSLRREAETRTMALGIADRVRFLGVTDNLAETYNAADLLMLPSSMEAWPLVVTEAMSCGLPCATTAVGCLPDIIEDGVSGFLIERSTTAIVNLVSDILRDPGRLERAAAGALAAAAAWTWPAIGGQYEELLKQVAHGKAQSGSRL